MANLGPMTNQGKLALPTPPKGDPIAQYATYLEAQRAVDFLSDNQFPVQHVTIVGSGLRMVERVTGRLTYARVAIAGAASGAWFGLFVGLLLVLFSGGTGSGSLVAAPLIGAAFGMMFAVISYAFTGGRRDFTSTSQIVASEYKVLCMPEHKAAALELLQRLPDGGSHPAGAETRSEAPQGRPGPSNWQPPSESSTQQFPVGQPPLDLPPPSGTPSPGPGPGEPGGPPAPTGWPAPAEPAAPPVTYGEMIERKRREERERAAREHAEAAGTPPTEEPSERS